MKATSDFVFKLTEGDHGCLMANLEPADAFPIREWATEKIYPENLAADGYESEVHVTVLFGFLPSVTVDDVAEVCHTHGDKVDIQLLDIGRFDTSPEYDVIKVNVDSPDLVALHGAMRAAFKDQVEVTHPEYCPHVTLAYVKKGVHPELDGHAKFHGSIYRLKRLVYSEPDSKRKHIIPLAKEEGCPPARLAEALLGGR